MATTAIGGRILTEDLLTTRSWLSTWINIFHPFEIITSSNCSNSRNSIVSVAISNVNWVLTLCQALDYTLYNYQGIWSLWKSYCCLHVASGFHFWPRGSNQVLIYPLVWTHKNKKIYETIAFKTLAKKQWRTVIPKRWAQMRWPVWLPQLTGGLSSHLAGRGIAGEYRTPKLRQQS